MKSPKKPKVRSEIFSIFFLFVIQPSPNCDPIEFRLFRFDISRPKSTQAEIPSLTSSSPFFFIRYQMRGNFSSWNTKKKRRKKKSFSHKVRIFPLKRRRRKNQKNKISRVLQEKAPNRYTKLNDIQTYFGGNKEGEISEEYKNWKLKEKIISKRSTCVWMVGVASA